MVAHVKSMGLLGIDGFMVDVEADLSGGLPGFDVVGLPGAAVRESRDRVRAALKNNGYTYPISRVTINLAPADIRKEGPIYDLPLLLALLKASGQLSAPLKRQAFVGELSLGGELRPVRGVLPMVVAARDAGMKEVFVPTANAAEGAVVDGISVYPVDTVVSLVAHLEGRFPLPVAVTLPADAAARDGILDFADVIGAGNRPPRAGGGGGGLAQRAADRPAGIGEKHAGEAAAYDFTGYDRCRSVGGDQNPFGGRHVARRTGSAGGTAFPVAASQYFHGGADRRRGGAQAGRGIAGA